MNKIIIEVQNGVVCAVYTQQVAEILIIDHDEIPKGGSPLLATQKPDATFKDGEAYQLFSLQNDAEEVEIREGHKRIKF